MAPSTSAPERLLQRLDWHVVRRLDGLLQGDYRTLFRGQGLDFADLREYQVGDDVRHATYGEGVIVDIVGEGERAEARVRFPGLGEKTFLLAWTPLQKLQPSPSSRPPTDRRRDPAGRPRPSQCRGRGRGTAGRR